MKNCRACTSDNIVMFLPLGMHPPANSFLSAERLSEPEPFAALDTHVCLNCGLVQIPNVLPADFFKFYLYVPSASSTMLGHFSQFASEIQSKFIGSSDSLLVDIGCNDGLFLSAAHELGVRTLGIDPAENIAELAREKGLAVVSEYFSSDTARQVCEKHGRASVIVTTNTFNHVDSLHAFMAGVDILLDDDGTFIVEVPEAIDYVEKNEFDTIYHEHLSIFSVKSLVELFRRFDMDIFNIESLEVHGGSMRVFSRKTKDPANATFPPDVAKRLAREEQAGLFSRPVYDAFADSVGRIKQELMGILKRLRQEGKQIAGYGAPAKGNTLLNYYGIGTETLNYLVDRSPLKQGLYSPGMHIPIVDESKLVTDKPDFLLILAWNFADEIINQLESYRRLGGKFILPIPEPRIIE